MCRFHRQTGEMQGSETHPTFLGCDDLQSRTSELKSRELGQKWADGPPIQWSGTWPSLQLETSRFHQKTEGMQGFKTHPTVLSCDDLPPSTGQLKSWEGYFQGSR